MQTDPEYEKKILDALAKNKAVNFGNYIPQISYMHIYAGTSYKRVF